MYQGSTALQGGGALAATGVGFGLLGWLGLIVAATTLIAAGLALRSLAPARRK